MGEGEAKLAYYTSSDYNWRDIVKTLNQIFMELFFVEVAITIYTRETVLCDYSHDTLSPKIYIFLLVTLNHKIYSCDFGAKELLEIIYYKVFNLKKISKVPPAF